MAAVLKRLLHTIVARPAVYEAMQRAAGAGRVRRHLATLIARLGDGGLVLDLGGGTGLYRDLWGPNWGYLCLDNDPEKLAGFVAGGRRDAAILGDAARVPLAGASLDAVFCTAVSHHLPDAALEAFVRESARVLKPGGSLLFLDAVWRPRRVLSRLLWAVDRGANPRPQARLLAMLGGSFRLETTETFAVFHEYVAVVATPLPVGGGVSEAAEDGGGGVSEGAEGGDEGGGGEGATYDPAYFERLFAIEDRHFWFRARNRAIAGMVGRELGRRGGGRLLEVGCGTGVVLAALERRLPRTTVIGMDLFAEGLAVARRRTAAPLVQADVHAPPFGAVFDLVGVFDVLEHLPDDAAALADLRRMIRPGGALVVTVPANRRLWSYFDEASRHRRRYETAELRDTLAAAGFAVEYLSPYMAPLVPPMWLGRRLRGLTRGHRPEASADDLASEDLRVVPVANAVMGSVLRVEGLALASGARLPFGTSLLALARRPDDAEGVA